MASIVLYACVYGLGLWLCPYPYPPFLEIQNMTRMQRMFTQNSVLLLTSEILGLWNISWIIVCRMWNCRWRWQAPCPRMTDEMHEMHYVHSCSSHSQCSHQRRVSQGSAHNVSFVSLWCQQAVWDSSAVCCQAFLYRGLTVEVDVDVFLVDIILLTIGRGKNNLWGVMSLV